MPRLRELTAAAAVASTAAGCGGAALNEVRPRSAPLRAMTFNIQSGARGLDGIAKLISEVAPDVVALQEVDRFSTRAGGLDQAAELAARTGLLHHRHFRATDYHGGAYGVAVLSRFPIAGVDQIALPVTGEQEPRTLGLVRLDLAGGALTVAVTHFSHLPTNWALRAEQSRAVVAALARVAGPKLVMGDLNDGAGSAALNVLRQALVDAFDTAGEGPDGTFPLPLFLPALRLDYVLATPELAPARSFVIRSDASDHYPLVAEFELRD